MKQLKYILCLLISSPLFGGGTPADIALGELQTLQKKIEKHQINPADIQRSFQSLTVRLSAQEKEKYKQILNEIIELTRKRGITLTLGPATQPTGLPAGSVQSGTSISIKPVPIEKLSDATFNALKEKLKVLKKNYKQLGPQEIGKTLDEIKKGFGTVPVPLEMAKIIEKIERFKTKLNEALFALTALGTKLATQESKNKLTDPKNIQTLSSKLFLINLDIKGIKDHYHLNKTIQRAAYNASLAAKNSLYTVIQESMKQAAQLNDNTVLYKLIRKYNFVANAYPAYSEKHTEQLLQQQRRNELQNDLKALTTVTQKKQDAALQKHLAEEEERIKKEVAEIQALKEQVELARIEEHNATVLHNLEKNDHYTMIAPTEVDAQLDQLNLDLLTEVQQELFDKILAYQDYVLDELENLKILDEKIKEARTFMAQKPTDADAVEERLAMLEGLDGTYKIKLDLAKKYSKGSWLVLELNAKIAIIAPLVETAETLWTDLQAASFKQEQTEFEKLHAAFQQFTVAPAATSTDYTVAAYNELIKTTETLLSKPNEVALYDELNTVHKKLHNFFIHYEEQKKSVSLPQQQDLQKNIAVLEQLLDKVDLKLEVLEALEAKMEQAQKTGEQHRAEELEDIKQMSEQLEKQGLGFRGELKGPEATHIVTPALKEEKIPESIGLSKIETESKKQTKDLLREQAQRREDL